MTSGAGFIGSAVIRQYIQDTEHEAVKLNATHIQHQSLITYVADRPDHEVRAERLRPLSHN